MAKKEVAWWVKELYEERAYVEKRYKALFGFTSEYVVHGIKGVTKDEMRWVETQIRLMKNYLDVLDHRCELHPLKEEKENV